jgi:hypothetical protein
LKHFDSFRVPKADATPATVAMQLESNITKLRAELEEMQVQRAHVILRCRPVTICTLTCCLQSKLAAALKDVETAKESESYVRLELEAARREMDLVKVVGVTLGLRLGFGW